MQRRRVFVAAGAAAVAVLLVAGQLLLNDRTSPASTTPTTPTETSAPFAKPRVIAPLPGGKPLPTIDPVGEAKPGEPLHPLASAPPGLVAGLTAGRLPAGSAYTVTFRPWGYGPAGSNGQTVAVSVTKVTPIGSAPDISSLMRNPQLFVMDAKGGGNVASGGTHTATVTFAADGDQLVPVLTGVFAPQP